MKQLMLLFSITILVNALQARGQTDYILKLKHSLAGSKEPRETLDIYLNLCAQLHSLPLTDFKTYLHQAHSLQLKTKSWLHENALTYYQSEYHRLSRNKAAQKQVIDFLLSKDLLNTDYELFKKLTISNISLHHDLQHNDSVLNLCKNALLIAKDKSDQAFEILVNG